MATIDRSWMSRLSLCLCLGVALAPALARAQDDDDEDEGPPAAAAPAPTPAPKAEQKAEQKAAPKSEGAPSSGWSAPAPAPSRGAAPEKEEEEGPAHPVQAPEANPPPPAAEQPGYLEGRAESTSPNELIHTVERKTYTASGHGEVTLYPAALQINSKFTNTDGVALALSYSIQENIALQVMGFYNYLSGNTGFSQSLLEIHARAQAADALYLDYGAVGGFEISPIYGKLAFYQGSLLQFRFVIDAGAGVGHTNVQLTPGPSADDPSAAAAQFGDAGIRFMGDLGLGFRILLGSTVALRLEVRDLLYTARVDHIDGCTLGDVKAMQAGSAPISAGCSAKAFGNPGSQPQATALNVSNSLLSDVSSDVVNDVVFFLGASILF
ncbi:MAG: outer membrane beta-barrel domain-containing protein [Myxococcales bacterium]